MAEERTTLIPTQDVPRRLCRCSDSRGFTLIETVISIVIILIAVVGLCAIVTTSIAPSAAPQPAEVAAGTLYVEEKLETILGDRRNPSASKGFGNIDSAHYPGESMGSGYTRTTTVGSWPVNTDTTTFKYVTVQVTHNGRLVAQGALLVANYQ